MTTATINVKVNTAEAQKSVNTLNQSINQFGGSAASLKAELRQTIQELQNLQPGSARFQELSLKAGELRDQIADTNAVVGQLAGNLSERLVRGITGVVSIGVAGFQTLASGVALFGGESEELQKTMVKLQALMNLSQAIETFSGLDQKIVEIRASFQSLTVATNTQTIAQEGENIATAQGTVATTALGVAMKALPIIAIVAAIGTLVYGIYQYVSANNEAAKQEKEAAKQREILTKKTLEQEKAQQKDRESVAAASREYLNLIQKLKDTNANSAERSKLIKEINATYGTTFKNLKDESLFQDQLNISVKEYIALQVLKVRQQSKSKAEEKAIANLIAAQDELNKFTREYAGMTDRQKSDYDIKTYGVEVYRDTLIKLTMQEENAQKTAEKYKISSNQLQAEIDKLTLSGKRYEKQTIDTTKATKDETKAIEEATDARKTYGETLKELIDADEALTKRDEEILKVRQDADKLIVLQGQAIAEVEKNRVNGIYKTADAYKKALGDIKKGSEEYLISQLAIIKKEGEAREKAKKPLPDGVKVKIGGGGEDPEETKKQKQKEKALKKEMDLIKKNFDEEIKNLDAFNKTKEELIEEINDKYVLQTELANLEIQKIILDSQQQEKLNLATTEQEKIDIRKSFADKIIQNEIDIINKQREIQVGSTKITAEEKLKIEAEAQNKILKLNEKSIDDTVAATEEKFDIFTEMRMAFAENNDEFQKNWSENWITTLQDLVGEIAQITGQITDLFSQAFQVAADNQLASLERLTAQEQEQLDASLVNREITDKQYEEKKKLLEKSAEERQKQIRKKEFDRQKALNIVNAVMNTAVGVTKALPNPVLMALAAVLGIAQVAIISSQQFRAAQGGVVPQNGQSGNVDSVPSLLAPGEVVINSQSSQMFPQLLSDINQAGGGKRLVPEVAFTNPYNQTNVFQPQQQMVQAYVVESQITNSQRRISRMERAASF